MTSKIYIFMFVAFLAMGGALKSAYASIGEMNAERDGMVTALEFMSEEFGKQAKENERVNYLLASRERERRSLSNSVDALKMELSNVASKDKSVRDYLDIPIPDGVVSLLRKNSNSNQAGTDKDNPAVIADTRHESTGVIGRKNSASCGLCHSPVGWHTRV